MPTYFEKCTSFEACMQPQVSTTKAEANTEAKDAAEVSKEDLTVNTKEFLDAAEGVVGVFVLLNSTALGLVQTDLQGNITKLRERCTAFPNTSATLEQIVTDEQETATANGKSEKDRKKIKKATESLLWLTRGLDFTLEGLKNARKDKQQSLSASFQAAYSVTLEKYHGYLVKKAIGLALKACPTRETLYAKLGEVDVSESASVEESVSADLEKWLEALQKVVLHIKALFASGPYTAEFN